MAGVVPRPPRGTVYICGHVVHWPVWRFVGVFDKEADAVACCIDANYFVAPAKKNRRFPTNIDVWPGTKFPRKLDDVA
jgi:hypothetical protein